MVIETDNSESLDECFKANDVLELAGLTYRQLHDWEKRAGVIRAKRTSSEGWRQFTLEEVSALAICSRLRNSVGLSLDQAGKIYEWLVGKQPNREQITHAAAAELNLERFARTMIFDGFLAIKEDKSLLEVTRDYARKNIWRPTFVALKMVQLGFPTYLVTDISAFSILGQDELVSWMAIRIHPKPIIVLPLNDILNKILAATTIRRYSLEFHFKSLRDYWNRLQDFIELSPSERKVLKLIRERGYQRITAHIDDGRIIRVEREEELNLDNAEETILEALRSGTHQRITIRTTDGKIVWIGRKENKKLDEVTEVL